MSTYTVNSSAGMAGPTTGTIVHVPNRLKFNGSTWVAAPESSGTHIVILKPGVVLDAEVGAYIDQVYPSLITVT